MNFGVQPNLIEERRVTERPEKRPGQHGLEINVSYDAIAK
jgi:hypothetical protein